MARIIAFHGTKASAARAILSSGYFRPSSGKNHWLGKGIYFFENAPVHALSWGQFVAKRDKDWPAAVIRVEIDNVPGIVNLQDIDWWSMIHRAHRRYCDECQNLGKPIADQRALSVRRKPNLNEILWLEHKRPHRKGLGNNRLDYEVMVHLVKCLQKFHGVKVQGARAVFLEGSPCYETSFFFTRSHAQIAILDQSVIRSIRPVPIENLQKLSPV